MSSHGVQELGWECRSLEDYHHCSLRLCRTKEYSLHHLSILILSAPTMCACVCQCVRGLKYGHGLKYELKEFTRRDCRLDVIRGTTKRAMDALQDPKSQKLGGTASQAKFAKLVRQCFGARRATTGVHASRCSSLGQR